jgi:hypothetical protein
MLKDLVAYDAVATLICSDVTSSVLSSLEHDCRTVQVTSDTYDLRQNT